MMTFQEIIAKLSLFWENHGCAIQQGYDLETGAGTFNPATFLRALGPEPYKTAYIEPSRRPSDGRYGTNPNRLQHFFQYQVILKPSPLNMQELYLQSLEFLGFTLKDHDIRFVHDDWESPTLGAWGLGWEVWMDGMEVTQYTYFQCVGGEMLKPVTGELTYGIERLAMYLQKVGSIYDLQWSDNLTYGDIYQNNEREFSHYNFEEADVAMWFRHFDDFEKEAKRLIERKLPLPAYDFVMKASHAFNMLDARGVISVTERTGYITRIRNLACLVAQGYSASREEQQYPLLHKFSDKSNKPETRPDVESTLHPELTNPNNAGSEDYLLEILSEELPAGFVASASRSLEKLVRDLLKKEEIPHGELIIYGTPRRLTAYIKDLAYMKPAKIEERKGPALSIAYNGSGEVNPAATGFFRSIGKEPISLQELQDKKDPDLYSKEHNGTSYLYANVKTPGSPVAEILKEKLPALILGIDFPKKMRWSDLEISYARPLRSIVSLFGKHVVPFTIGNIHAGRASSGHRQHCPDSFSLSTAKEYKQSLLDRKVRVDSTERKESILRQLDEIEKSENGKIVGRESLLDEVIHLSEWPLCVVSSFDSDYLKAPKEVLISEMIEHQRYFPIETNDGKLKNLFVITADNTPSEQIKEGNQRALSPRLADGTALYLIDSKVSLETFNEKLKKVTFQKELGSVYEKVLRIRKHAEVLQKTLQISSPEKTAKAALICKSDLASKMVFEFPELQGTMGCYYARAQGESEEVATAIREHWMPRGEKEPLPQTETGIILSLADKFDNLIGCFAVGLKPSSSSDPYALRRQTLGIIRILIQNKLHLSFKSVLKSCYEHFPEEIRKINPAALKEIEEFILNRIKTVFTDYGVNKDEVEAAVSGGADDIYNSYCKVLSLHNFRHSGNKFALLYEVYKRAKGQISGNIPTQFSESLLNEQAELSLNTLLKDTQKPFENAISTNNYDQAYELIAGVQPALAKLFEEVKVLADDKEVRNNRLALLNRVFDRFAVLLDFDKIQEK